MPVRLPETYFGVLLWLMPAVFICYVNALNGTFQFDDYNVIVNNPGVHSWASWVEGLSNGIRPLLKFTYTLNWTMGTGVIGFHLTNILIHLTNACLVYGLAQAFVQQQPQQEKLRQVPFFVALLFAAHPVYTEAVTYICGRSTSLMTLFYLAGLFAYVSGRLQRNNVQMYGLTPLFFVIALGVKETAVTFPLALLLWEYACGGKWKRALASQWPSWLVLISGALIFLFSDSYLAHMERSAQLNSLQGNTANQAVAFFYLMRQWALPFWLNIDPTLPLQNDFSAILLPLFFFFVLFMLMVACWRERPWISFALAWAMLQLIPLHLFLPRIDIANDRQMYLAGWPLFLALCIELRLWTDGTRTRAVVALLLLGLASLTVLRNQDYVSEIRLWEDTAIKSPDKARVHNNLGYAYMLDHRHNEARREFTTALQLDSDFYQARYNLYRLDKEADQR
jgi:hypothetical protein